MKSNDPPDLHGGIMIGRGDGGKRSFAEDSLFFGVAWREAFLQCGKRTRAADDLFGVPRSRGFNRGRIHRPGFIESVPPQLNGIPKSPRPEGLRVKPRERGTPNRSSAGSGVRAHSSPGFQRIRSSTTEFLISMAGSPNAFKSIKGAFTTMNPVPSH